MIQRIRQLLRNQPLIVTLYAGVATLLVAILADFLRNGIAAQAVSSTTLLSVVVIFLLALVTVQVAALRNSADSAGAQMRSLRETVQAMSDRSRFSMKYYDARSPNGTRELHRRAARVVRDAPAGAHIMAVNSHVEVFADGAESPENIAAQQSYLREYEKRFRDVYYHRLIQLPSSGPLRRPRPLASYLAPAYLTHYRKMAEAAENGQGRPVKLEEVGATIPTSFVVVAHDPAGEGGGEVIWQINRHDPEDPAKLKMLGIFVITDPDGDVVPEFVRLFQLIDSGQVTVLTSSDLADPPFQPRASA